MAGKCPYTKSTFYKELMTGELVEADAERDDNIFEVNEPIQYRIYYNNYDTKTKKPMPNVAVTIKKPNNKILELTTDSKGIIHVDPDIDGKWHISYYDKYARKSKLISFNVVSAEEQEPKPRPPDKAPAQEGRTMQITMSDFKSVTKKLEEIGRDIVDIKVNHGEQLGRIDEHLKTLNGTVARHEKCVLNLSADNDSQWAIINQHNIESAKWEGTVSAYINALKESNENPLLTKRKIAYAAGGGGILVFIVELARILLT